MIISGVQRDRILDAWAAGEKGKTIASREKLRFSEVCGIVKKARDGGDHRAADRGKASLYRQHSEEYWQPHDLRNRDAAFCARLQAEIMKGQA